MKLEITNPILFANIKLFQEMIRDVQRTQLEKYQLFVSRATGELLFVESGPDQKKIDLSKWKPICFFFHAGGGFEIRDEESHQTVAHAPDLDPLAVRLLNQMVDTLNRVVKEAKEPNDLKEVLQEILAAELEGSQVEKNVSDIVHDAWHSVDREGAEALLKDRPMGTYLFRKDEFADILEEQLSSHLRTPVKCFTLTYLGANGKVGDLTLVRKENFWYVYDDDPSLEETAYSNVPALIENLELKLVEPLLYDEEGDGVRKGA